MPFVNYNLQTPLSCFDLIFFLLQTAEAQTMMRLFSFVFDFMDNRWRVFSIFSNYKFLPFSYLFRLDFRLSWNNNASLLLSNFINCDNSFKSDLKAFISYFAFLQLNKNHTIWLRMIPIFSTSHSTTSPFWGKKMKNFNWQIEFLVLMYS